MNLKVFAIYDDAASAYHQPFFFVTNAMAIRVFSEMANDPNHQFCKYASQYTLFELGEFNPLNCQFELFATPHSLGKASEFRLNNQQVLFKEEHPGHYAADPKIAAGWTAGLPSVNDKQ